VKTSKEPVIIHDIKDRDRTKRGKVFPGKVYKGQHAEIIPGESIRLFGAEAQWYRYPTSDGYSQTFKLGDQAVYGSYNLTYVGVITGVSAARITVTEGHGGRNPRNHCLSIYEFNWRNRHFDLQDIQEQNARMMQSI